MNSDYTQDQLAREVQLLINELRLTIDEVLGDGAGLRAMALEADSPFALSLHPDEIDLSSYPIWSEVLKVQRYVCDGEAPKGEAPSIARLSDTVARVFSPAVVDALEEERHNSPDWQGPLPGPGETGAGEVPLGFFYTGILSRLLAHARVRAKVDNNERVTLGEIALLLDLPEQTVMTNAHRKKFPTVEDGGRRYAEPADALPWMAQYGYVPTTFEHTNETVAEVAPPTDLLFVPVAADGSWFNPTTQHAGRYVIGPKEAEVRYTDYFEALAALQQMSPARWRRKNANGIGSIVTGVRFDRVSRAELEKALAPLTPA